MLDLNYRVLDVFGGLKKCWVTYDWRCPLVVSCCPFQLQLTTKEPGTMEIWQQVLLLAITGLPGIENLQSLVSRMVILILINGIDVLGMAMCSLHDRLTLIKGR